MAMSPEKLRTVTDNIMRLGGSPKYVGELIERGKGDAARKHHIDTLGRGSRATGDHQPGAKDEALEDATKHIGNTRDGEFRNQVNAIVAATPKSINANVNWRGRGDD